MATSSNTSRLAPTVPQLQIKQYSGPPAKKPTLRQLKTVPALAIADEWPDIDELLSNRFGGDPPSQSQGVLASHSPEIESAELVCLGVKANCEIVNQEKIGNLDSDDDIFFRDERGSAAPKPCDPPKGLRIERSSTESFTTKGNSPENAFIIEDDPTELSTDDSDDECHRSQEERLSIEIAKETEIRSNTAPRRESTSNDALSLTFPDLAPLTDDEFDFAVLDIDRDGQTRRRTISPLQTNADETMPESTTCVSQALQEGRLREQRKTANASDSDDSDDDEDSDTLPTRKRKRSRLAKTAKRPSLRSKPSISPHEESSSDECNQESGGDQPGHSPFKRRKSTVSLDRARKRRFQPSRSTAKNAIPPSTSMSRRTIGKEQSPIADKKLPRCSQQAANISIHQLSSTSAFLTAFVDNCGDMRSNQATELVKSYLGDSTKLGGITIKPLLPGVWFLSCFVAYLPHATSYRVHRQSSTYSQVLDYGVSTGSLNDGKESGGDHNGCSTDSEDNGDDERTYMRSNDTKPLSSRRRIPWSHEEDRCVIKWKKEGRDWDWMSCQLLGRSPGAVQTHWYTKLRE